MAWLAGVAAWEEHTARTDGHTAGAAGYNVVAILVSLERKMLTWHVLAPLEAGDSDGIQSQFRVIVDDLRWQDDRISAQDISVVDVDTCVPLLSLGLRAFAAERGYTFVDESRAPRTSPDLMIEALERTLRPHAVAQWRRAGALLGEAGFQCCVAALYAMMQCVESLLENPRLEQAFEFTVHTHTEPVRDYMRLNKAARSMVHEPLRTLLEPFCITKGGRKCLLSRLCRPEVRAAVLDQWHGLLDEMLRSRDECKQAVAAFLESAATAEPELLLDSKKTATLEDFRVICKRIQRLQATCQAFHGTCDGVKTPQLHQTFVDRICRVVDNVLIPFAHSAELKLAVFEGSDSEELRSDEDSSLCVQSLRGQVSEREHSIETHRDEMASILLLQPERIKIVFEEENFSSPATKVAAVLFRVTRQDAHRVFKANAVISDRLAKKPKLGEDQAVPGTAVTLVYSRRTTGVWFSTPRLDTLAAQWRSLHREIRRVETHLLNSLIELYDHSVRAQLQEWIACVSQLDVVTAFAKVSHQYSFQRAVHIDAPQTIKFLDLRWPWKAPCSSTTATADQTSIGLDGDYPLLAVHSAIGDDGSLPIRIAMATVLHQVGCFVPCLNASLSVVDALFVRTGAHDQTLANESTFLSEMQEMRAIFTRATLQSLVLVDELCRGTSPAEGLPLAVEICRFLTEKKILTALSTQWTELLDELIRRDHTTVPTKCSSVSEDPKRAYFKQFLDCDQRFLSTLFEQDFPTDLIELIENDLS